MNEKYNALFTPWKIGNVEMKNRIVHVLHGRHVPVRLDGAEPL